MKGPQEEEKKKQGKQLNNALVLLLSLPLLVSLSVFSPSPISPYSIPIRLAFPWCVSTTLTCYACSSVAQIPLLLLPACNWLASKLTSNLVALFTARSPHYTIYPSFYPSFNPHIRRPIRRHEA